MSSKHVEVLRQMWQQCANDRRMIEADALDAAIALAQQPPSAPVGVVEALSELVDLMQGVIDGEYKPDSFTLQPARAALAQQPAPNAPVGVAEAWQQGYHQGVQDERTSEASIGIAGFDAKVEPARANPYLAQQPATVNGAMVERIAALLHEEATDEPWAVAGVEHDGPDRDYYRTLARKVIVRAAQQPEAAGEMAELVGLLVEVRSHFTRDDDLPDDLLPRIDAALAAQQGGRSDD